MLDASRTAAPIEAAACLGPGIVFEQFEPMRVMAVRHTLTSHPLLQMPALADLAERLGAKGAGTNFTTAPETHRVVLPPAEIVRRIRGRAVEPRRLAYAREY